MILSSEAPVYDELYALHKLASDVVKRFTPVTLLEGPSYDQLTSKGSLEAISFARALVIAAHEWMGAELEEKSDTGESG